MMMMTRARGSACAYSCVKKKNQDDRPARERTHTHTTCVCACVCQTLSRVCCDSRDSSRLETLSESHKILARGLCRRSSELSNQGSASCPICTSLSRALATPSMTRMAMEVETK